MDAPASTRLWKRYWFACPHCGFRTFGAHALVQPMRDSRGKAALLYSFWCTSCNRYSKLAHPLVLACAQWAVAIILFVLVYLYFVSLGWLILVPAIIAGIVSSYLSVPLLTRLLNRYVQREQSADP